jgi:SM-20-related protein
LPEAGRTAYFLSEEALHEVCPARRLRYSIACWFRADVSENLAFLR